MGADETILRAIDAFALKDQVRTGWQLRGVTNPESVADHSWGTAFLCLLYADEAGVDVAQATQMAVAHDLAEALTGDVATRVISITDRNIADAKRQGELRAMEELTRGLDEPTRSRMLTLWNDYENHATEVARFVRDMNLIDMCLEAYLYERGARIPSGAGIENFPDFFGMDEFFATTESRLSTITGARLFGELLELYNGLPAVADRGGVHLQP